MHHREPKSEIDDTGHFLQGASCTRAASRLISRLGFPIRDPWRPGLNSSTIPYSNSIAKFSTLSAHNNRKTLFVASELQKAPYEVRPGLRPATGGGGPLGRVSWNLELL
jgi:hypothetical protein